MRDRLIGVCVFALVFFLNEIEYGVLRNNYDNSIRTLAAIKIW